jgi:hypothetical protein
MICTVYFRYGDWILGVWWTLEARNFARTDTGILHLFLTALLVRLPTVIFSCKCEVIYRATVAENWGNRVPKHSEKAGETRNTRWTYQSIRSEQQWEDSLQAIKATTFYYREMLHLPAEGGSSDLVQRYQPVTSFHEIGMLTEPNILTAWRSW